MAETIDPPIALPPAPEDTAPAPKKSRAALWTTLSLGVFAVAAAGIVAAAHATPTPTAAAENPAYPLQGHTEQIDGQATTVCDSPSVQAWADGDRTVTVEVNLGTPGTVEVWIPGGELNGNLPLHLTQQTTKHGGTTAKFTTWVAATNSPIRVRANNKHVTGSCYIMPSGAGNR